MINNRKYYANDYIRRRLFWCTESVFQSVKGVQSVVSGYMGGEATTANYRAVCGGNSGHIEVVKVEFDDATVPLEVILDIFLPLMIPPPKTVRVMMSAASIAVWCSILTKSSKSRPSIALSINYAIWVSISSQKCTLLSNFMMLKSTKTSLIATRTKLIATSPFRQSSPNYVKSSKSTWSLNRC